ncbi:MAG: hypothetical protein L0099_13680 [Acidobacteria bacterium]|nr:hypothetical protein [Acidobacteriota bacterium]
MNVPAEARQNAPVKITGWKKWLLSLVFLGGFGFAGGGSFLLFALVPFGQKLVLRGWTQTEIDRALSFLVYGWFVFAFLVTALYARLTLSKGRLRAAWSIALVMLLAAGWAFYEFMHSESSAYVARAQGRIEEVSEKLSFGPYPDTELLIELKQQHYDGVITLLHPAVPFEKLLLDEELKNAPKVGIAVLSFPMLPWISDNKNALTSIGNLLQQPGKRYYVHCYLGQHRTNLVRQAAGFDIRRDVAYVGNQMLTTMLDNFSDFGVTSDGNQTYQDGQDGVHSRFSVLGDNLDVATYSTVCAHCGGEATRSRALRFTFDPSAPAFRASGIGPLAGSDFMAPATLSGINYWGRYRDMGKGTTAQVRSDVEFQLDRGTYRLAYASLAVYRTDASTWLVTSDPADIPGNPGFKASPAAELNVVRKRNATRFGTVNMPIRFQVTLKP